MSNKRDSDDNEGYEHDADIYGVNDTALHPGPNADSSIEVDKYIDKKVLELYDVYSYRHAAAILANSFSSELKEIESALLAFKITMRDIGTPGGNESDIPKKFSHTLRPDGWIETRIQGDLVVKMQEYEELLLLNGKVKKVKLAESAPRVIEKFIDGHKIDYVKGRVAFDLEWNSKDQTFDRDLYALRTFHECGLISAGVMVTRSEKLNYIFDMVPQLNKAGDQIGKTVKAKYGASTTWMGKLLYRLNAGRHGGCPILVFGITPKLIEDLNQ